MRLLSRWPRSRYGAGSELHPTNAGPRRRPESSDRAPFEGHGAPVLWWRDHRHDLPGGGQVQAPGAVDRVLELGRQAVGPLAVVVAALRRSGPAQGEREV